jgi:hypothetical protein
VFFVAAALVAPFLPPTAGVGRAAPAEASLDERWLFDELNARRRAAGAPALAWDALAYDVMRAARVEALVAQPQGADRLGALVREQRGLDLAWMALLRGASELRLASASALADADLLDRRYTQGAVGVAVSADGTRAVVAAYACAMPALLGRTNLNGPAGAYRLRCPACRRERVYSLAAPRGHVASDCPFCRTLLTPHLEDTRGALHWPAWYVRPYAPFALTNPFLAWKWVHEGVLYDHPKADRDRPGWQTPAETARLKTGVCRDTAVLLAAWLREMGHDARVVTGEHGGAHAWVVMSDGETRYLLETAGDGPLGRRYPPRLELATDYFPTEMMFDDRRVLLNRGQQTTRDYDSPRVWFAAEELP